MQVPGTVPGGYPEYPDPRRGGVSTMVVARLSHEPKGQRRRRRRGEGGCRTANPMRGASLQKRPGCARVTRPWVGHVRACVHASARPCAACVLATVGALFICVSAARAPLL